MALCAPRGLGSGRVAHKADRSLALWHTRTVSFWPCGTQGQQVSVPVAHKAASSGLVALRTNSFLALGDTRPEPVPARQAYSACSAGFWMRSGSRAEDGDQSSLADLVQLGLSADQARKTIARFSAQPRPRAHVPAEIAPLLAAA